MVSLLVPIYGVEQCIATCAESLFGQTYESLEYIFVDDCTPDRSIDVLQQCLDRFPHRREQVRIIHHQQNRGLGAARLTALQAATGDFVMHIDSDDYLATDAVERLKRRQQETGADIVDGAFQEFNNGTGGSLRLFLPYHGHRDDYLKLLLAQNTLPHQIWGRLIRRTLFTKHAILPIEGVNQAEDYALVPRLVFFARRAWVDEVVSYYRVDAAGTFKDGISPRHVHSLLRANQIVAVFYAEHDKEGTFAHALQLGLLKTYYLAVRAGVKPAELKTQIPAFSSRFLLRTGRLMLRCPYGDHAVRLLYLVLKRWLKIQLGYRQN